MLLSEYSVRVQSFVIVALLLFAGTCQAATYYVDGAAGDDANNGLSLGTAFKTIGKSITGIAAGDTVLIKGGVYREHIRMMWKAGTADNPITIKNYDNEEVILDGSTEVAGWAVESGNIYKSTPGFTVSNVVVDNAPLRPAVTQTNDAAHYIDTTTYAGITMHAGEFYQDNTTGILYVWTPDGTSPAGHTLGVLQATADNTYDAIYMWNSGYCHFENLTIRFAGARGIDCMGDNSSAGHNTYKNLKIVFNSHTGIVTGGYAQLLDCEIGWNFMWNWPRGKFNGGTQGGGWGAGVSLGNDSVAEGNSIHNNGGEGMLSYMNPGNIVFRNNEVYDNWSMNLYADTVANVLIEGNLVYSHDPDLNDARNNGFPSDGTVIKGMRAIGIGTADEYYGGPHLYYLHDVTIRNNIVINCRRGYNHFAQYAGSGMKDIRLHNNTIITPSAASGADPGSADNFLGIYLTYNGGNNTAVEVKNNIVVARHQNNYPLYGLTGGTDTFANYSIDHNLWHNTAYSKPIHWGPDYPTSYDYTLAQWQQMAGTAHGQEDISTDPQFAAAGDAFSSGYYLLSAPSPCVGTGATLMGFSTDFNNYFRDIPWDRGALASGSSYQVRDATAPFVTAFSLPSSANSLTVAVNAFAASDNVAVQGYLISETSATPQVGDSRWSATIPASYVFSSPGTKTVYAWVKDAAGNVSAAASGTVVITMPDTPPSAEPDTMPATTIVPAPGTYTGVQFIILSADEPATIYYTTDGTTPTEASTVYISPIPVTKTTTLKYFAKDSGGNSGAMQTAVYTITPPASNESAVAYPVPFLGNKHSQITFTSIVPGSTLEIYTLDGQLIKAQEVSDMSYSFTPNELASGTYLYIIKGLNGMKKGKIVLVK